MSREYLFSWNLNLTDYDGLLSDNGYVVKISD